MELDKHAINWAIFQGLLLEAIPVLLLGVVPTVIKPIPRPERPLEP